MKRTARIFMWVIVIAMSLIAILSVELANKTTQEHKIISVDKVERILSYSEGGVYTEVYYLVTTDKGAYIVAMEGFNAAPQYAGLQKDSTYIITTRGIKFPFFGIYPYIIDVKK